MIDRQTIRGHLRTLAGSDVAVGDDDSLLASRLLDSLKVASLVALLENEYRVTFDGDELTPENLDTINAIAALLERKGVA